MYEYTFISLPDDVGRIVRQERKEQGLSQTELGLRSGCSQRFISELERGKQTVEMAKVLAVLESLGLEIAIGRQSAERSRTIVYESIDRIAADVNRQVQPHKKLADYLE